MEKVSTRTCVFLQRVTELYHSPYYLLIGHNTKLQVDFMLGTNQSEDSDVPLVEWIDVHQKRLRYAYDKLSWGANQ